MKFYTSLSKGLKLKVRKFWGLIPTFVEVTGEKLGFLPLPPPSPILNRVKTPKCASFCKNQSALENKDIVEESISELLKYGGSVIEAEKPAELINPLSFSIISSGKMRLILDLRYVNTHVYKDKIKFEDWKCLEHHLEGKKGYVFKFDLKNDYHDIDIIEPHQKFLTFSWVFKGNIKIFRFYSFTIWTNQCIIYFHQGSQSLSQIFEIQFCQNYLLFG